MSKWPKDNQAALIAFYGDPGSRGFGANLVKVVPPFKMRYAGKAVAYLSFHRLAAPSLLRALNLIWGYYGKDQGKLDALRISEFSGTYNPRKVRGSATKWSNHAYGAAIDLDAPHNGFNSGHGHMPLPVVAAFKACGFSWGGDYQHRTDPMHFELCDRGEPARTFEEWLTHYGCPPSGASVPAAVRRAALVDVPSVEPTPAEPATDATDDAADVADDDAQEGAIVHETPKGAPKTGISEGAQLAGGLTLAGIGSQVWDALSKAPESILNALIAATQKPSFWIFGAIGCAALYIWWQRHAVKKGV
jgi:hypothetical protein